MTATKLFTPSNPNILSIVEQLNHLRLNLPSIFLQGNPILDAEQISSLVEAAFWSSLKENEGRTTKVSIAVVDPTSLPGISVFLEPVTFDENQIAKLAPAVPLQGCLLVDPKEMNIFAICHHQIHLKASITLDVIRPGVLQIGVGIFRSFIVFSSNKATSVLATGKIELANEIRKALPRPIVGDDFCETQVPKREALAIQCIADAVRTNGHGGALLLVPDDDEDWIKSISPFEFQFKVRNSAIPDSIRTILQKQNDLGNSVEQVWQANLPAIVRESVMSQLSLSGWVDQGAIDSHAKLANIDGAVVLTASACLVGFGAKIKVTGADPEIAIFGPSYDDQRVEIDSKLENLGGMRHQSAARFIGANHSCAAIVVSEDGPMSFFSWDDKKNCVVVIKNVDWWC